MTTDFFARKASLVAEGKTFGPEDLQTLGYPDLVRVAIGDAGKAACPPEVAREEILRRHTPYLKVIRTKKDLGSYREELEDLGMYTDFCHLFTARGVKGIPKVGGLSRRGRIFFLVRCLRSHQDNPGDRLRSLLAELEAGVVGDSQEKNLLTVLLFGVQDLLKTSETGEVTAEAIRDRTRGYHYLARLMTPRERIICLNAVLQGWKCSGGCFAPKFS